MLQDPVTVMPTANSRITVKDDNAFPDMPSATDAVDVVGVESVAASAEARHGATTCAEV